MIARDIPFPINFLSSWLAEKFDTHQTSISPAKLVGIMKYTSVGLTKHFNESQANAYIYYITSPGQNCCLA